MTSVESKTLVGPVAVVDDDPTALMLLGRWLEDAGFETRTFTKGHDIVSMNGEVNKLAVICLDLDLGDMSGLDVIKHLKAHHPDLPIIMITGQGDVDTAVEAMRAGAYDFLVKPIDRDRLVLAVRRAAERRALALSVQQLKDALAHRESAVDLIIGQSDAMRELMRQLERVLDSDVAVAVFGESGTGKELVARAIHNRGHRARGPFVAINCAAIPESLHESELFGHERGAFTGAVGARHGRFEQAESGTLFLDEIGEMSALTQASLLRTLQERTIRRVGGTAEVPVDVRIICATNRDLLSEVRGGRFREDLYFRLVVYPITIPPIRARTEDIPLLVVHFLDKYREDVGREVKRISPEALEAMARHNWPGNVRELENVVHRAMLACDAGELTLAHLPSDIRSLVLPKVPKQPDGVANDDVLSHYGMAEETVIPIRELERRAIQRALKAAGGSVEKAARLLGMGRATLYRRLAHYQGGDEA